MHEEPRNKSWHNVFPRRMDDVGLDNEVFVQELRPEGVVGVDAANFGCGEVDLLGFFVFKECINCLVVREVKFRFEYV